jgi:CTP synthase
MTTKFIFITGGVVSSLGKGLASASLASLLQVRGYKVKLRKLDPYLNIDPGTMSPTQHGEVFVTEDGAETDLDIGHYERFSGVDAKKTDSITAGQIYLELLSKERKGDYLGGTVQVIPHVTDLIKKFILNDIDNIDFILCEIGGTVGDIEALPFFEAIRQLDYEMPNQCAFLHLTLLPYIESANEIKTKPTQHSVKELRSIGIQPNVILCRVEKPLEFVNNSLLEKIALMCSLPKSSVIPAPNCNSIYDVPIIYHELGLDREILKFFKLDYETKPDLSKWYKIKDAIENPQHHINIALVGKYNDYKDSYKSLLEAINHAGFSLKSKINIIWINARENINNFSTKIDGILVPGGFGKDGTEGKIAMIKYARENKIPFLGICFGMQMAVIEFARNILKINDATSSEISDKGTFIVGIMNEWQQQDAIKKAGKNLGGTMRLGSFPCNLKNNSLAHKIYKQNHISERHRHRFEVNIDFKDKFEKNGMIFSGISPDNKLPEIIELDDHPFFIAVQFHPELKSKPFLAHPLFIEFVNSAIKYHDLNHKKN